MYTTYKNINNSRGPTRRCTYLRYLSFTCFSFRPYHTSRGFHATHRLRRSWRSVSWKLYGIELFNIKSKLNFITTIVGYFKSNTLIRSLCIIRFWIFCTRALFIQLICLKYNYLKYVKVEINFCVCFLTYNTISGENHS